MYVFFDLLFFELVIRYKVINISIINIFCMVFKSVFVIISVF